MDSQADWGRLAGKFQQDLGEGWKKAVESFQAMARNANPSASSAPQLQFDTEQLQQLQQAYLREAADLWNKGLEPSPDRRFAAPAWKDNPVSAFSAAVYLLNARTLLGMVETAQTDEKTKGRLRFAVEQWLAASAPSNFMALNAEAQKKAIETQGESIAKGIENLWKDIQQGHVSMTDMSLFEVGRNVATTEGAVVFENDLFQLIEYRPLTAKVYERPFLVVPPCINKFYILDLQPDNSLVRFLVEQGHRTFVVSWRNPDESIQQKTWDDYIGDGAIRAI
ncbi:MAG: class I poly(R)-hydroxyalkanoic acid synthase, partial [Pseudomonadota bacterium]